jgi:hypothetical protein
MAVANADRRQTSLAMIVISTGIFLLAVLFTLIRGFGLYVSLGLLVLGCFSMIIAGIHRETSRAGQFAPSRIVLQDSDDI